VSEPDEQTTTSALTCFVIGPIGSRLAEIGSTERETYEDALRVMAEVVEPACAHHGLAPVRADTLARPGEITEQIFRRLRDDDVVIADVTGANANVMYELGLRHTRDKLTIQIGEYGRLPFDVNTIRTILFSRSRIGLVDARDELTKVLTVGLGGDYDPVAATRVWNESAHPEDVFGADDNVDVAAETPTAAEDERGFIDIMAEAEDQMDDLTPSLEEVGSYVVQMGELAERSTELMERSDAAGKGMRGRLQVVTQYATGLSQIADKLEPSVDSYASVLDAVSAGTLALIERMEEDPEALEEGQTFGMTVRQTASATRESLASLAELVESIRASAGLSRVLRQPSQRITAVLDRFVKATSTIDEWDRRLQSLGIPVPPADWESDSDVDDATNTEDGPVYGRTGDDSSTRPAVREDVEHPGAHETPPKENGEADVQAPLEC
jgi:hypothetical protein